MGALVGLGVAGTGYGVLIGTVSKAVPPERRNQVVGLVAATGSLATFVLAPLGQYFIANLGWHSALLIFAGVAASMGALAVFLQPEASESVPDTGGSTEKFSAGGAVMDAFRHRGFVTMTVAFFACGFQLMFITTHLAQFLAICGVASSVGANAIGVIGLSNAAGSYFFGVMGGRYSQKRLLASIYLLRTFAIVSFLAFPVTPITTLLFAAAMGFLWLGVVPLVSGLIRKLFGLRYFSTLFGLAFFSHQVGGFLGSWLGGLSYDLTGSYSMAWLAMVLIGLGATVVQWVMNDEVAPGAPSHESQLAQAVPA